MILIRDILSDEVNALDNARVISGIEVGIFPIIFDNSMSIRAIVLVSLIRE